MAKTILKSPASSYEILKEIGRTKRFNLYLCESSGTSYVLKIALTSEENGVLDREALILADMRTEAARLEEAYGKVKKDPAVLLNYQLCFPNLHESFISEKQGGRRVNILGFNEIEDLGTLVPMLHISRRDQVRVDCRTSAWMMGKLLKFLDFVHSQDISLGRVTGDNILVERKEHYVLVFDLTLATIHTGGGISNSVTREEISRAAHEVICVLGGNFETREWYIDDQDPNGKYVEHLYNLACGSESVASIAHERFYTLIRSLWPREYWPFTSYPLEV